MKNLFYNIYIYIYILSLHIFINIVIVCIIFCKLRFIHIDLRSIFKNCVIHDITIYHESYFVNLVLRLSFHFLDGIHRVIVSICMVLRYVPTTFFIMLGDLDNMLYRNNSLSSILPSGRCVTPPKPPQFEHIPPPPFYVFSIY